MVTWRSLGPHPSAGVASACGPAELQVQVELGVRWELGDDAPVGLRLAGLGPQKPPVAPSLTGCGAVARELQLLVKLVLADD
jgi:hypothetical protein